jgi:hypothetical protein
MSVFVEGILYGMALLALLERVVFPVSFRISRALDRFQFRHRQH